jgi:hypothetical protein
MDNARRDAAVKPQYDVSGYEFRLPQDILTFLQFVSNDVELLSTIKPGRDRAA